MISADVAILGTGPAGLAAAVDLAAAGLRIAVVAPAPEQPWGHFLGLWLDEAEDLQLTHHLAERWPQVQVRFQEGETLELSRTYTLLDNQAVHRSWLEVVRQGDVRFVQACADDVQLGGDLLQVACSDGTEVRASHVLDATGARAQPGPRATTLAQAAYGIVLRPAAGSAVPAAPFLMDYANDGAPPEDIPTFLYVLPFGDGTLLLEETSLARAPAVPIDLLRQRLWQRLGARGIRGEVLAEESVLIPLDIPLPDPTSPRTYLGAASGRINPLSGYSLPAAIGHARHIARELARCIQDDVDPAAARARLGQQSWSDEAKLARELRLFGIRVLAELDLPDTQKFLRSLFVGGHEEWRVLLGHGFDLAALERSMRKAFMGFPLSLQIKAAFAFSRHLGLLVHLSQYRSGRMRSAGKEWT